MSTRQQQAQLFCDEILPRVSRTFALSIRLLPGALGDAVRDSYLLCRIADTIEDAPNLGASDKADLLDLLAGAFDDSSCIATLQTRLADLGGAEAHVRLA